MRFHLLFLCIIVIGKIENISAKQAIRINGIFEYNEPLSEPSKLDSIGQKLFSERMRKINITLLENYVREISSSKIPDVEKAEKIIESDSFLINLPERARLLLYIFCSIDKYNLTFMPCLSKVKEGKRQQIIIYGSGREIQELRKLNSGALRIKVEYVTRIKYLKIPGQSHPKWIITRPPVYKNNKGFKRILVREQI